MVTDKVRDIFLLSNRWKFASQHTVLFRDEHPQLDSLFTRYRALAPEDRLARLIEAETLSPDEPRPEFYARVVCDGKGNLGVRSFSLKLV